jgi:exodeoxyribonuclease VII large subunit
VVRAVAASRLPVISAVGHETDTSLCDFAADVRAPTPTAAAELAVPVRGELLAQTGELSTRLLRCTQRLIERRQEQLGQCLRAWPARERLLEPQRQRVDELADRLPRALRGRLDGARAELHRASGGLRPGLLAASVRRARDRLESLWRVAELAHPNRPLARGYARVEDRQGGVLTSAMAARKARLLQLVFGDGAVDAVAGEGGAPRRGGTRGDQPKLL